ncbi:MAG: hypothetical protein Q7K41_02945, partial [Dehalococcoidales bacterium]|nr:hypothetical protein [Dehalococcoidales bacterium]
MPRFRFRQLSRADAHQTAVARTLNRQSLRIFCLERPVDYTPKLSSYEFGLEVNAYAAVIQKAPWFECGRHRGQESLP